MFRVALEGFSPGHWPGSSPMGNPLKPGVADLNALSWVEYGARCGADRALAVLARHQVRATFITCGVVAERYPELIARITERGHEVCGHSYAMDVMPPYLDPEAERANIRRTADLIEKAGGVRPTGWISPRATPSVHSFGLLAQEGFLWHGDTLNDDLPYVQEVSGASIVAIPGTMEVNDLTLTNFRHPAQAYVSNFSNWLEHARTRETGVVKLDPTIHAHCYGRPGGIWAFERALEMARQCQDIWIGTRGDIAEHVRAIMRVRS